MRTYVIVGVMILTILVLGTVVLAAEDNRTAPGQLRKAMNESNMTYGQCVSEYAALKNECYAYVRQVRADCVLNATQNNVSGAGASCTSAYSTEKKQCKQEFKSGKTVCGQYRKTMMDRVRFWR